MGFLATTGRGLLGRAIGLAVTVAVVAGGYFVYSKFVQAQAPEVGQCVSASGGSFDAEIEEVACDAADATYEISADDGKCDDAEYNYSSTVKGYKAANLCLMLNVREGDCVKPGTITRPDQKVACKKGDASQLRVLLVDTKSAAAKCPKDATAELKNRLRHTTVCLGKVG